MTFRSSDAREGRMFARRLDENFWAGPRTRQVRALLVISFEKEFVEVGDKEAEPAPNQQYDLDGQEPWLVRFCDPDKQGEHQGH